MSTAFAAAPRTNIEFANAAGTPLYLDCSIPQGAGPFAAAIIVHGGGWVRGDRHVDVAPLFHPLEEAGIAWFSIDYRLAGDITQFGTAIDDVRNAVLYVKAHASEYRIDPERIALIGESAGGQLAAMAALEPSPGGGVKAVVGIYAPTDLVALATNSAFIPAEIRNALHGTPFESILLARLEQLSPLQNVKSGAPPFLLIHGTADPLVPFKQSRAMCDRLRATGGSCVLYPVEGAGHGIRWWDSQTYKAAMTNWLTTQLGQFSGKPPKESTGSQNALHHLLRR